MKVWILLMWFSPGFNSANSVAIDNIATAAECERVRSIAADTYDKHGSYAVGRCIEVTKAATK